MALYLEIIHGDQRGLRLPLRGGLKIGRRLGDLVLQDPKVSARHAHVETDPEGDYVLVDDDSSNGIRSEGRTHERLVLLAGVVFQIGDTVFRVRSEEKVGSEARAERAPSPKASRPPPPPELQTKKHLWAGTLADWLESKQNSLTDKPLPLSAFYQAIVLRFVQGRQFETQWLVAYGPRQFGALTPQFRIAEPGAPSICFELVPAKQGVIFRTHHEEQVRLNQESIRQAFLKEGNQISIGQTVINIEMQKTT